MNGGADPVASVVLPCLDEEGFIEAALDSLLDAWTLEHAEILVLDGGSRDRTRSLVEGIIGRFARRGVESPVRLLENPAKIQAAGLNTGIRAARGEFVVRADAHCVFPAGYVRRCVERLREKEGEGAANVGGVMRPAGASIRQKAVARAMSHPLGVGDARFHLGGGSGWVDTAYLGTFRKSFLFEVGLYDETFRTNEDAELNLRILRAGRKIYLDETLEVGYAPRRTFGGLSRQYFRYGRGRARTLRKHRRLTSWRQALPPVLVVVLAATAAAGFFDPRFWLVPAAYALTLAAGVFFLPAKNEARPPFAVRIGSIFAVASMHLSWGAGFLVGLGGSLAATGK